ncbi:hypothetical protein Tco_1374676 [Tanacetum coccineum]
MLKSKAYQTYYAFASGEKAPKLKYVQKKANSDTSPKKKLVQATKGNGVDTQSKVPDEQQQKTSSTDEGTGTIPGVPDVPTYESKRLIDEADSERTESDRAENIEITQSTAEHEVEKKEEYSDQSVYTPPNYQLSEEEKNDDEGMMDDEEEDEVTKELYKYVNINLGTKDVEMTDADQGGAEPQNKADDPIQSSSVSSDFTSKLLNLDNTPPRLDETSTQTSSLFIVLVTAIPEITSATTVPPQPPFFNHVQQEATPAPTPTTSKATTSTLALLNFAFVFRFNERVTDKYEYIKNHKKTIKSKQARTQERKSKQKPEAKPGKVKPLV